MHSDARVALHQLHLNCSAPLKQILRKLLGLQITQQALGQIIDGIPTKDNYFGPRNGIGYQQHPDIATHLNPSEEACSLAEKLCSSLDLETVNITARTAESYQRSAQNPSESQSIKALRFLEASSSVIHDIISNIHHNSHSDKDPTGPQTANYWQCIHRDYTYGANYKNSYASAAAYWAETLIFGGPVLFRRGEDGQQCTAAYIHPRDGNIAELTESQILQYYHMATASPDNDDDTTTTTDLNSLLPFSIQSDARRLTIKEAIAENVYRERGQLDLQWGNGKKYGLHRRSKNCHIRVQPNDRDTDASQGS